MRRLLALLVLAGCPPAAAPPRTGPPPLDRDERSGPAITGLALAHLPSKFACDGFPQFQITIERAGVADIVSPASTDPSALPPRGFDDARKDLVVTPSSGTAFITVPGAISYMFPRDDLAVLAAETTLRIASKAHPEVHAEVVVTPEFCSAPEIRSARGGEDGGAGGSAGVGGGPYGRGLDGGAGGQGGSGDNARPAVAKLGYVDTQYGRMIAVQIDPAVQPDWAVTLFNPKVERITLNNGGGFGGNGGEGGAGGEGAPGPCRGGDGGNGGPGANGGDGGNGATLTILYDRAHPELVKKIKSEPPPPNGGLGGRGGAAGRGAAPSTSCPGQGGVDGAPGPDGGRGRPGTPPPRPVFKPVANPFPDGVASLRAKGAAPPREPKHPGVTTHEPPAAHDAPAVAAPPDEPAPPARDPHELVPGFPGTFALTLDNRSAVKICELVAAKQGGKVISANLLAKPVGPGQTRKLGTWGTTERGRVIVRMVATSCDKKKTAIDQMVSPQEDHTILIVDTAPTALPKHSSAAL